MNGRTLFRQCAGALLTAALWSIFSPTAYAAEPAPVAPVLDGRFGPFAWAWKTGFDMDLGYTDKTSGLSDGREFTIAPEVNAVQFGLADPNRLARFDIGLGLSYSHKNDNQPGVEQISDIVSVGPKITFAAEHFKPWVSFGFQHAGIESRSAGTTTTKNVDSGTLGLGVGAKLNSFLTLTFGYETNMKGGPEKVTAFKQGLKVDFFGLNQYIKTKLR